MLENRFERLELKFAVDELTADRVREHILGVCEPDAYNRDDPQHPGYTITSLYLDSPTLLFHRAKLRGDAYREKLRIRSYGCDSPAIFERKVRRDDFVLKTRSLIHQAEANKVLEHGADSASEDGYLERFLHAAWASAVEPTLLVRYRREAFASQVDDYARVTFDREIAVQPVEHFTLAGCEDEWQSLQPYLDARRSQPQVVLELKCESDIPGWMIALVKDLGLVRCSISKYSIGILASQKDLGMAPQGKRLREWCS